MCLHCPNRSINYASSNESKQKQIHRPTHTRTPTAEKKQISKINEKKRRNDEAKEKACNEQHILQSHMCQRNR